MVSLSQKYKLYIIIDVVFSICSWIIFENYLYW